MASDPRLRRMIQIITDDKSSVKELPDEDKELLAEFVSDNMIASKADVLAGIEMMPGDSTPLDFAYVFTRTLGDWKGMVERARKLREL